MPKTTLFIRASLAAPLALLLAACGGGETEGAASLEAEPIAAIPAPEGQDWTQMGTATAEGGYVMGNPDAPLKLIEYASFTCGACANFAQSGVEPLKDYVETGVVSYELRNLIRDPLDLTIARLARCSTPEAFHPLAEQSWMAFNEIMTQAQQAGPAISAALEQQDFGQVAQIAGLLDFFAARGVSRDQALACLADTEGVLELAETADQSASALGVDSTPTFFLNGEMLEARQWPQLEPVLQRAGARQE